METVRFLNWNCHVQHEHYNNGRTCIQLYTEQGEPMATATVNVPCFSLAPDEVLVKDYAENTGILECLSEAGVILPTGKTLQVGQAVVHVCKLPTTKVAKSLLHH